MKTAHILTSAKQILVTPQPSMVARQVMSKTGHPYWGVPLTLDNATALRHEGYPVSSPCLHDGYVFQAPFTPYGYQKTTTSFMTMYHRLFCLNEPGLGKTACSIWATEYLRQQKKVRRTLIICPLSTMRDTWEKEVKLCAVGSQVALAYGAKQKRVAAIQGRAPYIIINHDGIKTVEKELVEQEDIDLVIVDESTLFKNPTADRTRSLVRIVQAFDKRRRLWALTGTPMSKMPTDPWTMARLICPDRVPESYTRFRDTTCTKVNDYAWRPRRGAADEVLKMLHPSICYRKSECLDLPPVTHIDRSPELTPTQARIIKQLTTDFMAEYAGKQVTLKNAGGLVNKVLQVCQGVLITGEGEDDYEVVGSDNRIDTVKELIEASNSKTIIAATFKSSVKYLYNNLNNQYGAQYIHGGVSEKKRTEIFKRFREDPEMRVLIVHPKTTAHGLTLVSASTIIWYGPEHSSETYIQLCNRIDRPGQVHNMSIYHLASHRVETAVYNMNKHNLDVQNNLLDIISSM
jgi:SNF2 family DNA or RNA helicase